VEESSGPEATKLSAASPQSQSKDRRVPSRLAANEFTSHRVRNPIGPAAHAPPLQNDGGRCLKGADPRQIPQQMKDYCLDEAVKIPSEALLREIGCTGLTELFEL
jgi:hypothetical protein